MQQEIQAIEEILAKHPLETNPLNKDLNIDLTLLRIKKDPNHNLFSLVYYEEKHTYISKILRLHLLNQEPLNPAELPFLTEAGFLEKQSAYLASEFLQAFT